MTKASLRRQREREEHEGAESGAQRQTPEQLIEAPVQQSEIPRMEPPPPYDAPHLPPRFRNNQSSNHSKTDKDPGCWNSGPGEANGCLNHNSGSHGPDFVVEGCCNYDSSKFLLSHDSSGHVNTC